MKNKILFFFFLLFFQSTLFAKNLEIISKNIYLDKKRNISIFENEVIIQNNFGDIIKTDYAEYDKNKKIILLKKNISVTDKKGNIVFSDYAKYFEEDEIFISEGPTKVITTEKYLIESSNVSFDRKNNVILSKDETKIIDKESNSIFLNNFEYLTKDNIFKSIGKISVLDNLGNSYKFSQIYIDTIKKEILGTDAKAFLNESSFKDHQDNKPRIFSNTLKLSKNSSVFEKNIFTTCNYRTNDKCPPWSIQSSKMLHDNKKKTIYYDNALIKVYNIPVFYTPRLSHPDPSVDRMSGFLIPSFSNSKNLGSALTIPYFWNLAKDKNFTLTNKFYVSENPLFVAEYQQAFEDTNLITEVGYTQGYKKTTTKKTKGEKSHLFAQLTKNFKNKGETTLDLKIQDISNDKYLKVYKPESILVDYNEETLENSINIIHEKEDIFFGLNALMYETLKEDYNDKYEYILPEVTLAKNLFNDPYLGNFELETNFKVHNYDTNKLASFLINDLDWNSKEINHQSGIISRLLGNVKNINYETKNLETYKEDPTYELYGAIGYLGQLNFEKNKEGAKHLLSPKLFVRYAPGNMRKETNGFLLKTPNAFELNRINNLNNYETGLSSSLGLDYTLKKNENKYDFSIAQIINQLENKKMHSKTSLDEKLSDLVGEANINFNNKINMKYNFSLDQNYKDINYNELSTSFELDKFNLSLGYLQQKKHIGSEEYFKTNIKITPGDNSLISFKSKKNLVTSSSEFYNLSYEYINDCLRAGLVYRREFYQDSELEPEDSLMFQITLSPFGTTDSPNF
ncbi:LPS-assembly protein LptD [Pelagibacterales bacterium SAG-MED41]|nr:LPS-assembly protein LptD [Pelagibacterales bacterium SAG-MED41]